VDGEKLHEMLKNLGKNTGEKGDFEQKSQGELSRHRQEHELSCRF